MRVICYEWTVLVRVCDVVCLTVTELREYIQSGREISAIIVTDDYLCHKETKSPYNFLSYFNI